MAADVNPPQTNRLLTGLLQRCQSCISLSVPWFDFFLFSVAREQTFSIHIKAKRSGVTMFLKYCQPAHRSDDPVLTATQEAKSLSFFSPILDLGEMSQSYGEYIYKTELTL